MKFPYWQLMDCSGRVTNFTTEREAKTTQAVWAKKGVLFLVGIVQF